VAGELAYGMMVVRLLRGQRRVLALVQMLLFVFSSSTMLLPCAQTAAAGDATSTATTAAHHHGNHQAADAAAMPTSGEHPRSHHAPGAPDSVCPWVVGCVGMLQFALDASWTSVESAPLATEPVGRMLGYVTTDRDIESPPPRA
jgi:hypothetical protein